MMKKIMKGLSILGLTLSPIFFVNAQEVVNNSVLLVNIPDSFVVGNFTYDIDRNLNFHTDGFGNYLDWVNYPSYNEFHNIYGWIDNRLYYVSYDLQEVQGLLIGQQGFIDSFCATTDITELCTDFNITARQFYNMQKNITKVAVGIFYFPNFQGADGNFPFGLCFYNSLDSKYYCAYSAWVQGGINQSTLTGSLGFSTTGAIENFNWGTSPIINENTTTPTEQYTCPTIQQLIDTYPQQYNTGLCYSSNIIYSGGTIQTITPKTIFELYPTRINLNQDIQNYNTYCNNVATQQACQTIFEGKNEEYTLIAKIPQDVMPLQLYAYCNLTLNQDPNSTTCTASTGAINNGIGINDIINNIGNTPITVITPGTPPDAPEETGNQNIYGSGSVFDKYKQAEDDIKRRNIIRKAEDTIQTMRQIYAKLTGIFRARQGSNGIIPPLITGLIALIVLYKLFKK